MDLLTYGLTLLATVSWQMGEVDRARELIERAKARAITLRQDATSSITNVMTAWIETMRDDAGATLREAEAAAAAVNMTTSGAKVFRGWARARVGDYDAGLEEMRAGLAECEER
jgi:hypothetical protein